MFSHSTTCSINSYRSPLGCSAFCAGKELGAPVGPGGFTASSCGKPLSRVFCCPCSSLELIALLPCPDVRPFPALPRLGLAYPFPPLSSGGASLASPCPAFAGTTASADYCRFNRPLRCGLPAPTFGGSPPARLQSSPGKNAVFPSMRPPHLLSAAFGSKDLTLACRLIQLPLASIGVREPRAGSLPLASFRFHLTMDTLAFGYGYCYLHRSGLSP
jgi:hypothetical protein